MSTGDRLDLDAIRQRYAAAAERRPPGDIGAWDAADASADDVVAEVERLRNDLATVERSEDALLATAFDFLDWLISLNEPGSGERRTITLNQIIQRARVVRGESS